MHSSASIFWYKFLLIYYSGLKLNTKLDRWCGKGGFAQRKCTMDESLPSWFDEDFPPLAIYYGGRDYLVATEPLLERLRECEKYVKLVRVQKLAVSEVWSSL